MERGDGQEGGGDETAGEKKAALFIEEINAEFDGPVH